MKQIFIRAIGVLGVLSQLFLAHADVRDEIDPVGNENLGYLKVVQPDWGAGGLG